MKENKLYQQCLEEARERKFRGEIWYIEIEQLALNS